MSRIRYVAYGSNLHPMRLAERVPSARLRGCAILDGYELRFHKRGRDGSGKCNIVEASGRVFAAVFDLDPAERHRLDEAESLGTGYREMQLNVPGHGRCFTYTANECHIDDELLPFGWYKSLVLLGCVFNGFSREYLGSVQAVPERQDPDPDRHIENMRLVERMRSLRKPADVKRSKAR